MSEESLPLDYEQKECLVRLRDLTSKLSETTGSIVNADSYQKDDSKKVYDLINEIMVEVKCLYLFYNFFEVENEEKHDET